MIKIHISSLLKMYLLSILKGSRLADETVDSVARIGKINEEPGAHYVPRKDTLGRDLPRRRKSRREELLTATSRAIKTKK